MALDSYLHWHSLSHCQSALATTSGSGFALPLALALTLAFTFTNPRSSSPFVFLNHDSDNGSGAVLHKNCGITFPKGVENKKSETRKNSRALGTLPLPFVSQHGLVNLKLKVNLASGLSVKRRFVRFYSLSFQESTSHFAAKGERTFCQTHTCVGHSSSSSSSSSSNNNKQQVLLPSTSTNTRTTTPATYNSTQRTTTTTTTTTTKRTTP